MSWAERLGERGGVDGHWLPPLALLGLARPYAALGNPLTQLRSCFHILTLLLGTSALPHLPLPSGMIRPQHPYSESVDTLFIWVLVGERQREISGQKSSCPQTKHPKSRAGMFYQSVPFLEDPSDTRTHADSFP